VNTIAKLPLMLLLLLLLLGLGLGLAVELHADPVASPDLAIFFVDDMGYSDLSCFGGSEVITPHIDRMAAEGMKLTTFYSAAPVCTPSRAGLLLGRLPKRTGFCGPGVMWCNSLSGIPSNESTWAAVLQQSGRFRTLMVGKWHLGHTAGHLPTDHGFDGFLGLPYSQDIGFVHGNTTKAKTCDVKSCGNSTYGCYPLPLCVCIRLSRHVLPPRSASPEVCWLWVWRCAA
jgi:arylsulfatase A